MATPAPTAPTAPTSRPAPPVPTPVAFGRPPSASAFEARPGDAFRLRVLPTQVELWDLRGAPAEALEAAGVSAGLYWMPALSPIFATPGVNGIERQPGWSTATTLQHGYSLIEQDVAKLGGVLLDAWHEVAAPFAATPGPLIREIAVRYNGLSGKRYLTPWEQLVSSGPGRPAALKVDRAICGCWVAWMIRHGQLPAAEPSVVAERQQACAARVERRRSQVNVPADVRESLVSVAADRAAAYQDAPVLNAR